MEVILSFRLQPYFDGQNKMLPHSFGGVLNQELADLGDSSHS